MNEYLSVTNAKRNNLTINLTVTTTHVNCNGLPIKIYYLKIDYNYNYFAIINTLIVKIIIILLTNSALLNADNASLQMIHTVNDRLT